ncbi:MAG: multidrug effflux MFS transporter [Pseudomonadota bacterium]
MNHPRRIETAAAAPRLSTLVLLTALSVLTLNMFLPSLARIAEAFEADYALVNLAIGGYLAVVAVMQIVIGPLSDRYGRRPVMFGALAIYVIASLGCLLAGDIITFLVFRMLQATVTAGWILSLAVIRDTSPQHEAASRIGYLTMAMAVAPMLGPMVGGVLDETFGWRSTFVFYVLGGIAMLCVSVIDLRETNLTPSRTFTEQIRTYPDLLRARRFWGYALCMAFSTGAFYAFLAGAPLVADAVLDLSPALLGVCLGSITAGFMVGSFLSGRYAGRGSPTALIVLGRLSACIGPAAGLIAYTLGFMNAPILFAGAILVGLGNGLTMPGCNAGTLSVRPDLAGSAAGLSGALTIAAGAILSSITGLITTPENGPAALFGMMLFCGALGLLAILYVRGLDRETDRASAPSSP